MTQRYKVALGEMQSRSEHTTMGTPVGEFVIGFTVEPPVKFYSEVAAAELGRHVLVAWNAIGRTGYSETGSGGRSIHGNNALITFSHESADEVERATKGVVSGYDGAHPEHFDRKALQQAFDIVLNGEEPEQ